MTLPSLLPRYLSAGRKRTRNNIQRLSVYRPLHPRPQVRSTQSSRSTPAAYHDLFSKRSSHGRTQDFETHIDDSSSQFPSIAISRSSRPPVDLKWAAWNPSPSPSGQDRIRKLDSRHINAGSPAVQTNPKLLLPGRSLVGRTDRLLPHSVGRVQPSRVDNQTDGAISDYSEPTRPSPERRMAVRPLPPISAVTPSRETYGQASRLSPRTINRSMASSYTPTPPRQLGNNVRPESEGWEETSAENDVLPTSNADSSAEIHLDGQILGQWVIDQLQWSLTRPQIGINSVNSRANPIWPGQTNFMDT